MKKLILALAAMVGFSFAPASAATLLTDSSGQLIGVRGIEYRGTLYDVEFGDGRCTDLFSGCDEVSDFVFQSSRDAGGMANLLKNWVILDSDAGMFRSNPALTSGCTFSIQCEMLIPFGFTSTGEVRYASFLNGRIDGVLYESLPRTEDTVIWGTQTFARFALSSASGAVPEPSTWAMMLIGFGAVGGAMRYRRRQKVAASHA